MSEAIYWCILTCVSAIFICSHIEGLHPSGEKDCELDHSDCRDCYNESGIQFCQCKQGFVGDGYNCRDRDECTTGSNFCDQNALCINTFGSYRCSCNQGYTGDGRTCTYFDECKLGLDDCSNETICVNTDSLQGYKCACQEGLTGDGKHCYDLDECEVYPYICPNMSECRNQYGNYSCVCGHGYEQDHGGHGCKDIDECAMNQNFTYCPQYHSCINKDGGYGCECLVDNCHPDRVEPKTTSSQKLKYVIIGSSTVAGCIILIVAVTFVVIKCKRKRYEGNNFTRNFRRTSGRRYHFSDADAPYMQHINLLEPNGAPVEPVE
uniref:EGF-like domain-containing protein n=1 Tax=Clytia hemisphaerica TaxID=252671 RepID=A0A7M6DLB4_9CNID